MATTVYLVRHGRTALNASGLLRGRIDEPLDAVGRTEASRLGVLFSRSPLSKVISSPLQRSVDTARAIAEPHGLTVTADPAFADRDYGPWSGKPLELLESRHGSVDQAPAQEVEARTAFHRRVVTALDGLVAGSPDEIVVLVGHDAVNKALIRAFCEAWRAPGAEIPQPTGCWNRLTFTGRGAVCDIVGAVPGDGSQP
jgi:glucosyl-3-phosphoglycerate phosphatase